MAGRTAAKTAQTDPPTDRALVWLAGVLLLGGLLVYLISTMFHPADWQRGQQKKGAGAKPGAHLQQRGRDQPQNLRFSSSS